MFEFAQEHDSLGSRFGSFALQFIFSYPAVAIASQPLCLLFSTVGLSGKVGLSAQFAGYEALGYLTMGTILGWWVGHAYPGLRDTGRWVGLIPSIVFLAGVV